MWLYQSGSSGVSPPVIIYDYQPGRSGLFAKNYLQDFKGQYLQTDGYSGYAQVCTPQSGIVSVGCRAHAWRNNEYIARKANAEDQYTGQFWEGRFKSQALLDEQAILSCMIYVDLNPIRAELCDTLEQSDYTSIQQRIEEFNAKKISSNTPAPRTSSEIKLATFTGNSLNENGIAFSLTDYLELADWTGRIVREDKRGYIKPTTPGILQKLQLDEQTCYSNGCFGFWRCAGQQ